MGRINSKRRRMVLGVKHNRQEKLHKLQQQYLTAKSDLVKQSILKKISKITPWISQEESLKKLKEK